MKVYISGPIEGNPNYKKQFKDAKKKLKKAGHTVICPILPEGIGSKEEYLMVDFAMIDMCDVIYVIPNSHNSIGSVAEQIYARLTDKRTIVETGGAWASAASYIFKENKYIYRFPRIEAAVEQYIKDKVMFKLCLEE